MENCIHSELLGAADNNNLPYLGYLKIHIDSDNRSSGDDLLKVQSIEQNSKLFIANTDAVLSNGTKEYNFGTFDLFGETPNGLFPVNVGEYDLYVPKYAIRRLTSSYRNVIVDFDLSSLNYSKELCLLMMEGRDSAKGNIAYINGIPILTADFNVSSVVGDINSVKDAIINGFKYQEEQSLTVVSKLLVGVTAVGGVLKTFLDAIAAGITQSHTLNINIYNTSVDVTGTNATTTITGEHVIAFDGQGGYTITPPSA